MHYALLFFEDQAMFAEREHPERAAPYWAAWTAYAKTVAESGLMVGGAGLAPPGAATSIRTRDGQRQVQDGPHAETKEQLGGFLILDVPDLDAALAWAARSPAAGYGAVEVRPVMPPPPAG